MADSYIKPGSAMPPSKALIKSSIKPNIFTNLGHFFKAEDFQEKYNQAGLLASMLTDLRHRKGYSLQVLVDDLIIFCEGHQDCDIQCRTFIQVVLSLFRQSGCSNDTKYVQGLLRLLWKFSGTFHDIYADICLPNQQGVCHNKEGADEKLLYFLKHGSTLDVTQGNITMRFVDAPLMYGESPLMLASRHRRPDSVLLLLRHGANIMTTWLYFHSSLEVLLFAPNQVFISEDDKENIELCLEYYLRAMKSMDVKRLQEMNKDGYAALHPNWKNLIPENMHKSPASLKHLCKHTIRHNLNTKRKLPNGIQQLPLPSLMKKYIDLESH